MRYSKVVERGPSSSQLVILFLSCLASLYVMGRLWVTSRESHYLHQELQELRERVASGAAPQQQAGATPAAESHSPGGSSDGGSDVLFYSIREGRTEQPATLVGPSVDELPPLQEGDGSLLGQVDSVHAGLVAGWACRRGGSQPLQVLVYVDGVQVAEVATTSPVTAPQILRMCQGSGLEQQQQQQQQQVLAGFAVQLPALQLGKHELRAFVRSPDGGYKQELNQSPLLFKESNVQPDAEEQLRRKDHIIQIRNAQIAALWDELHTRQPWRNAVGSGKPLQAFGEAEGESDNKRLLAFLGINTGLGAKVRRDILRRTWVPTGSGLEALERELGVRIRFVVGQSEQRDDPMEKQIQAEMREHNDIMRLDMVDTYQDLSLKTLKLFSEVPHAVDADFYFKIDDDVGVNVRALAEYLAERRSQGNLYLGCMKSGQVLTDKRWKWYEPEYWRFGDPASNDGRINYMRHASGQLYGVSRQVALYIGQNAAVLHRFANEDVTLGTWLVGLEIQYADERRLCCDSEYKCAAQTGKGNVCLGYYEHQCAGTCYSEQRLEPIYRNCLEKPFDKAHREAHPHPDTLARQRQREQEEAQKKKQQEKGAAGKGEGEGGKEGGEGGKEGQGQGQGEQQGGGGGGEQQAQGEQQAAAQQ